MVEIPVEFDNDLCAKAVLEWIKKEWQIYGDEATDTGIYNVCQSILAHYDLLEEDLSL